MASDSINRINEAEEYALHIERDAESSSAALLAEAESAARAKVAGMDRETEEEVRRILSDAEEFRRKMESDALRAASEESRSLRASIAPRVPEAVARVRDLLIGKV